MALIHEKSSDAQIDFKDGGPSVEGLQIRSVACVPLWDNREVIGLIYVDSRLGKKTYTEDDLRLLTSLANVAAARQVTLESSDGAFSQEAPLAALESALLLYRLGDGPLPASQGGPVRFLIPNLEECGAAGVDRCTNVKALGRITVR